MEVFDFFSTYTRDAFQVSPKMELRRAFYRVSLDLESPIRPRGGTGRISDEGGCSLLVAKVVGRLRNDCRCRWAAYLRTAADIVDETGLLLWHEGLLVSMSNAMRLCMVRETIGKA